MEGPVEDHVNYGALRALQGLGDRVLEYIFRGTSQGRWGRALVPALAGAAAAGDHETFSRVTTAGGSLFQHFRSPRDNITMLGCAALGGNAQIAEAVLQIEEVRRKELDVTFGRGQRGRTAMHVAIERGAFDVAMMLLNAGASPNIADEAGVTALHLAAKAGCVELLERIIDATGTNIEERNHSRHSPLHMAAIGGQPRCVEMLLQAGACVGALDKKNHTPLYLAVADGNIPVVKELLARGATASAIPRPSLVVPEYTDARELGMPPCMGLAARRGWLEMVQTLLTNSDAAAVRSNTNATALHFVANGSTSSQGAPLDQSEIVYALANHVDIHAVIDQMWQTALHVACTNPNMSPDTVRALLIVGAEINAIDVSGNTALHVACHGSLKSVVGVLLQYGADMTIANEAGQKPVDMLRVDNQKEKKEIIGLMAVARAWRQRGWMVMWRAREAKRQEAAAEGKSTAASPKQGDTTDKKMRVTEGGEKTGSADDGRVGGANKEADGFARLVGSVIHQEEGIFRLVVSFL